MIVSVNGASTQTMSPSAFKAVLQARTLELKVVPFGGSENEAVTVWASPERSTAEVEAEEAIVQALGLVRDAVVAADVCRLEAALVKLRGRATANTAVGTAVVAEAVGCVYNSPEQTSNLPEDVVKKAVEELRAEVSSEVRAEEMDVLVDLRSEVLDFRYAWEKAESLNAQLRHAVTPIDLIVGSEAQRLGMALQGSPPGHPLVKEVSEHGWAFQHGVPVGSTIVAVDGREVGTMTPEIFQSCLRYRPVRITFRLPLPATVPSNDDASWAAPKMRLLHHELRAEPPVPEADMRGLEEAAQAAADALARAASLPPLEALDISARIPCTGDTRDDGDYFFLREQLAQEETAYAAESACAGEWRILCELAEEQIRAIPMIPHPSQAVLVERLDSELMAERKIAARRRVQLAEVERSALETAQLAEHCEQRLFEVEAAAFARLPEEVEKCTPTVATTNGDTLHADDVLQVARTDGARVRSELARLLHLIEAKPRIVKDSVRHV